MLKTFILHKKTRLALKLFVPAIILGYIFLKLDMSLLMVHIRRTDLLIFSVSFGLLCLRNVIGAYRSCVLLRFRNLHYSTAALARYYFIGNFFNLFLPEIVGRDIARGYYLYNTSSGKTESISSIVAERFIGTGALMLLSLFSVLLAVSLGVDVLRNDVIKVIVFTFGVFCIFMALFFYERTDRFLEGLLPAFARVKLKPAIEFIRDVITYNKAPAVLWYTLLISIVFQFIGVIATYLVALSLGSDTGFIYFLILLPVIWVLGMLPVSINGLGVREGSFVLLFGTVGMTKEMAMAISILWFVQNIGLGLIGGVIFVLEGRIKEKDEG
ncbi:MAG: flippase-like domain-containing protein [Spirochaetales bacterium]|nr:flippase-like domain-containing protein [Spirochaetales bacterium]